MRNPDRIPKILERLQTIWEKHPDLRLGQLICNHDKVHNNLFYLEDDDVIEYLEEYYKDMGNLRLDR